MSWIMSVRQCRKHDIGQTNASLTKCAGQAYYVKGTQTGSWETFGDSLEVWAADGTFKYRRLVTFLPYLNGASPTLDRWAVILNKRQSLQR